MTGWIKLHRKIKDSELYPKGREFTKYEAWLDLLMIANHSEKNVVVGNEVFVCKRGQSVRSVESYQKQWNWTRQQVRCFFDLLVRLEMITKETTSKTTILTICNYDTYQGEQPTENQQNEDPENNQQNNQQKTIKTAMLNGCETVFYKDEQPTNNQHYNQHYNHKQEVKKKEEKERVKFTPPALPEIQSYFSLKIHEKGLHLNPVNEAEKFEGFYSSKNWMVGKNKMTDWRKAVSGWIARAKDQSNSKPQPVIQNDISGW
jgi:hypothetical protein